jgi:hypothetical protein
VATSRAIAPAPNRPRASKAVAIGDQPVGGSVSPGKAGDRPVCKPDDELGGGAGVESSGVEAGGELVGESLESTGELTHGVCDGACVGPHE